MLTATSPEDVWTDLDWSTVTERDGAMPEWEGCPDDLDVGYHFLGTGMCINRECGSEIKTHTEKLLPSHVSHFEYFLIIL